MKQVKALEVINLTKEFHSKFAIKDINFSIDENTVHGFIGPNGAGKTTTMSILSGLLQETSGEVKFFGKKITAKERSKYPQKIGHLPEIPPLYVDMTVEKFLYFITEIHNVPKAKCWEAVDRSVVKTGLEEVRKRRIGNLSKGYKQRVGIAHAICFNPQLLILDEPVSGLDPHSIIEIRKLILDLKEDHTILLSSHRLNEISLCCDDITIINNGKILLTEKNTQMGHVGFEVEVKKDELSIAPQIKKLPFITQVHELEMEDRYKYQVKFTNNEKNFSHELLQELMKMDVPIISFGEQKNNLEEKFLSVTKER